MHFVLTSPILYSCAYNPLFFKKQLHGYKHQHDFDVVQRDHGGRAAQRIRTRTQDGVILRYKGQGKAARTSVPINNRVKSFTVSWRLLFHPATSKHTLLGQYPELSYDCRCADSGRRRSPLSCFTIQHDCARDRHFPPPTRYSCKSSLPVLTVQNSGLVMAGNRVRLNLA